MKGQDLAEECYNSRGQGNDNVQTTLGVRAYLNGKSALDRDTGCEFQPYVKAYWVHNAGEYGVRMNGMGDSMKGTRNAVQLKAGVNTKVSSRLSIWGAPAWPAAGVTRTSGPRWVVSSASDDAVPGKLRVFSSRATGSG